MSKWQKIDPAEIKVGDRVKCVDDSTDCVTTHSGIVTDLEGGDIVVGINGYIHPLTGTWYIAKPKKAKPPTRPDEPPVGTFFRVDRRPLTTYRRVDNALNGYICVTTPSSWLNWNNIVDLGDTIKMLELREVVPND